MSTIIVHYTRSLTLELFADLPPEERDELIRDAVPEGCQIQTVNKIGTDGDVHTIGCNEAHCPHYNCNRDPEAHEFCYVCEPEEE